MTHKIKWQGKTYYQTSPDAAGDTWLIDPKDIIRDLDGTINDFNLRLPAHLNTLDASQTCKLCNTAFRLSDQRDPDRCPYCHRLLPL